MDIHVPQEYVEFILWYKTKAAGLRKALVWAYLNRGRCNSVDPNRSIEKLQSLEQRELLKISEPEKRLFDATISYYLFLKGILLVVIKKSY